MYANEISAKVNPKKSNFNWIPTNDLYDTDAALFLSRGGSMGLKSVTYLTAQVLSHFILNCLVEKLQ